ncbi:MAG: deoxyhypusine synthase [Deltaproteobacteria bacterium]|nr:deoxyhypusine synthase [Deltaproteobacteria bacterium]
MSRHSKLKQPVRPVEVRIENNLADLLRRMGHTAFQGKNLSLAVQIWLEMLKNETTILLGLAGALVPAGMRHLLVYLIKNRMIDCLVSTGANLFHDLHETLGKFHWQGNCSLDDVELKKEGIDRIYDVFAVEKEFVETDRYIMGFARSLPPGQPLPTREFFLRLGEQLIREGKGEGIITAAAKAGVPIYCPAMGDSSIGIALALEKSDPPLLFDILTDVRETAYIVAQSKVTGVIFLGGGTPKNFIQQTEVTANLMNIKVQGHRYAIQVTTDAPHWGGLSGCTFEEAQSWGKIFERAQKVTLYCDATVALPLMATAVAQESKNFLSRRFRPDMPKLFSKPQKRKTSGKRGQR